MVIKTFKERCNKIKNKTLNDFLQIAYKMLTRLRAKILNINLSNEMKELNFKKPSEKQQIQWLKDTYCSIHLAIQQVDETNASMIPSIRELVYYHNLSRLGRVPLKIAKRLLDHPVLTCNDDNIGIYYKSICGTFYFVCKDFLKFFGHSRHVIIKQLKIAFNDWDYNLDERVKTGLENSRKNIFSTVDMLKHLDQIRSTGVKEDIANQYQFILQNSCLYFLSALTLNYKQIKSTQSQESDEMKLDLRIFHIDLDHPFDYTPQHIYKYLGGAERIFEHVLNGTIVKSNWIQEKPKECPVCLDELGCEKHLSCGHYVHKQCVLKSKKACCPICRSEIELDLDELEIIFSE